MNADKPQYFLMREAEEFANRSTRIIWDAKRKALVLGQNQTLRLPDNDSADVLSTWQNATTIVVDKFNQQGRIAADGQSIEYNAGAGFKTLVDGNLHPVDVPAGNFVDIALGGDGRLAAAYSNDTDTHGVLVFHLAKRWQVALSLPERPLRVVVDKDNKVWCATASQLICCVGEPLPHTYTPKRDQFEPVNINPHPLKIVWQMSWPVTDAPLALCHDQHYLYALVHDGLGGQTIRRRSLVLSLGELQGFTVDSESPFAMDIHALRPSSENDPNNQDNVGNRLALMTPQQTGDTNFIQRDCTIVQLQTASADEPTEIGQAFLVRERFPMLSQVQARFVSSADGHARYQAAVEPEGEAATAGFDIYPRRLQALQRPRYYTAAMTTLSENLDSGLPNTIWHRLYMEGCIPPGTKVIIYAKAYNNPDQRTSTPFVQQQTLVWCAHRSEQAFGQGIVDAKPQQSGLFELLLQRNKGPVRRLQGRYLQLRVRFESDSRHSPAIHALKIVYPRLSYQERYLPEHFRQEFSVDPALDDHPANGADVRERLLAAFEGVLSPIENQIASSEVLLNPENTPAVHLPWLAELLGQNVPDHWPEKRQRRWLAATGELQRWRGTLAGLNLALDIISDGAVGRGQIVLVENFRLRRTMATILGLNMDDEDHPLTLGTGMSGNSIVGDSLILAENDTRSFLALFSPELATATEAAEVEEFFNRYANRVTVLLHGEAKKLKGVVTSVLHQQLPAQLEWAIVETDHPFVLGLAPLLGVDTFIERRPPPKRVTLDDTYLGKEGLLQNPAALSPQDVNRVREM